MPFVPVRSAGGFALVAINDRNLSIAVPMANMISDFGSCLEWHLTIDDERLSSTSAGRIRKESSPILSWMKTLACSAAAMEALTLSRYAGVRPSSDEHVRFPI